MDWIEKIFGLNPDGGDGTTETMLVIACAVLAIAAAMQVASFRGRLRVLVGSRKPRA